MRVTAPRGRPLSVRPGLASVASHIHTVLWLPPVNPVTTVTTVSTVSIVSPLSPVSNVSTVTSVTLMDLAYS